jgi:hypothetical protein
MVLLPSEVFDLSLFGVAHPCLGVLLFPPCERRGSVPNRFNIVCEPAFDRLGAQDLLLRLEFLDLGVYYCELILDFHGAISLVDWIALLLSITKLWHAWAWNVKR